MPNTLATNTLKLSYAVCGVALLLATSGCALSPQAKEAKFLKRGQELMAKKVKRALLEFRTAAQAMPRDAERHTPGLAQSAQRGTFFACARCVPRNYGGAGSKLREPPPSIDNGTRYNTMEVPWGASGVAGILPAFVRARRIPESALWRASVLLAPSRT